MIRRGLTRDLHVGKVWRDRTDGVSVSAWSTTDNVSTEQLARSSSSSPPSEEAPAVRFSRRLTASAVVSTMLAAGLAGCTSDDDTAGDVTEVVIGADLASGSAVDTAYARALQLKVEQINASGTLGDRRLVLRDPGQPLGPDRVAAQHQHLRRRPVGGRDRHRRLRRVRRRRGRRRSTRRRSRRSPWPPPTRSPTRWPTAASSSSSARTPRTATPRWSPSWSAPRPSGSASCTPTTTTATAATAALVQELDQGRHRRSPRRPGSSRPPPRSPRPSARWPTPSRTR